MTWRTDPSGEGVLVACDEALEWLLPWWWARYSTHNHLPVVFVDLGMSHFGKEFCHSRGRVVELDLKIAFTSQPLKASLWEELFGKEVWRSRKSWFKKPFAFLQTPFAKTLWLDLDCEVLKNLDPLFEAKKLLIAKDPDSVHKKEKDLGVIAEEETVYNSGVILYEHECPVITKWTQALIQSKEEFVSDQHVLSRILFEQQFIPEELDPIYNWRITQGININAAIIHWVGAGGKAYIRNYGGLGENPLFQVLTQ